MTVLPMLEVVTPGLLSTIQDAGRPDYADLGVPLSGACDPWGLAQANLLLGNGAGAATLEVTVTGPELLVLESSVIALGGADLRAQVPDEFRELRPGRVHLLRAGSRLVFAGAAGGARAYLALAGGIAVPEVLDSAATYLPGSFGGLDGRPLRAGDRLRPRVAPDLAVAGRVWPEEVAPVPYDAAPVRVLEGPHLERFGGAALHDLLDAEWQVDPESDRTGLRLHGPPLAHASADRTEIVSQPMVWGAVQVPGDGQPVVLLADHQTVGGYPVLAVVIRADWPRLGQLRQGSKVRFALISLEDAQLAYRRQQEALAQAVAALRRGDQWQGLADAAEG